MCHNCLGDGCAFCGEDGTILLEGNLWEHVTDEGFDLFEGYKYLQDYQIFPVSGGWTEQSSRFLHCVKWCDQVNLKYKQAKEDDKQANIELINKMKGLKK